MHIDYDSEFPELPYEHYCWLLENLENYKYPRNLYGGLRGKITMSEDCFKDCFKDCPEYDEIIESMYDTTPEFEATFRKNFRKLLVKS